MKQDPAAYRIGGVIDPATFGVFMPPGGTKPDGTPLTDALLVIKRENLAPMQLALEKAAVIGVKLICEPLTLVGFELLVARLQIAPKKDQWGLIVLVAEPYQAQTLAVFAHAAAQCQKWQFCGCPETDW